MKHNKHTQNLWLAWMDSLREELEWMESSPLVSQMEIESHLELMFAVFVHLAHSVDESS